jgi:hypothetical protein
MAEGEESSNSGGSWAGEDLTGSIHSVAIGSSMPTHQGTPFWAPTKIPRILAPNGPEELGGCVRDLPTDTKRGLAIGLLGNRGISEIVYLPRYRVRIPGLEAEHS